MLIRAARGIYSGVVGYLMGIAMGVLSVLGATSPWLMLAGLAVPLLLTPAAAVLLVSRRDRPGERMHGNLGACCLVPMAIGAMLGLLTAAAM